MSRSIASIAVKTPNRFVTLRKRMSGFASGSAQGANTGGRWVLCAMVCVRAGLSPARAFGSGARLDLGPEPRHRPLHPRRIGREGVEVLQRRLVRVDRRIADHVLEEKFLRCLIAVGIID